MSNYTVSNIGQNAATGSTTASFLKIFSGEVITAFETANSTLEQSLAEKVHSFLSLVKQLLHTTQQETKLLVVQ